MKITSLVENQTNCGLKTAHVYKAVKWTFRTSVVASSFPRIYQHQYH